MSSGHLLSKQTVPGSIKQSERHFLQRRGLVLRLEIPGVLGGILGVYVLVETPAAMVRVFVSVYLLCLGSVVLLKAMLG